MSENDIDTEVAALGQKIYDNPETQREFLRLAKKADPSLHIPAVEAEVAVEAATAPLKKTIEDMQLQRQKDDQIAALNKKRDGLKAKGATDADIERVEKFMMDNQIGSHEKAWEFMQANDRPAAPSPSGIRTAAQMPAMSTDFLKNPVQGARDAAAQFLNERAKQPR